VDTEAASRHGAACVGTAYDRGFAGGRAFAAAYHAGKASPCPPWFSALSPCEKNVATDRTGLWPVYRRRPTERAVDPPGACRRVLLALALTPYRLAPHRPADSGPVHRLQGQRAITIVAAVSRHPHRRTPCPAAPRHGGTAPAAPSGGPAKAHRTKSDGARHDLMHREQPATVGSGTIRPAVVGRGRTPCTRRTAPRSAGSPCGTARISPQISSRCTPMHADRTRGDGRARLPPIHCKSFATQPMPAAAPSASISVHLLLICGEILALVPTAPSNWLSPRPCRCHAGTAQAGPVHRTHEIRARPHATEARPASSALEGGRRTASLARKSRRSPDVSLDQYQSHPCRAEAEARGHEAALCH
jgi:hypothetical protein